MPEWKEIGGVLGSLAVGGFIVYFFLAKLFQFLRHLKGAPTQTEMKEAVIKTAENSHVMIELLRQCVRNHERILEATQENTTSLARVETLLSRPASRR